MKPSITANKQPFIFPLAVILFIFGCTAKSMHAVGLEQAQGNRLIGVVSQRTANKGQAFISRFHSLIESHRYGEAYNMLSAKLQRKLSLAQLKEDFYYLQNTYGPEQYFALLLAPITGSLPDSDMALYLNGFSYYEVVIFNYVSERNIDIIYSFGVTKEGLGIKIASLGFSNQRDWQREHNAIAHTGH